ncbi:unnamed protein product, partial [Rotaria magnacalcarata]
IQLVHHGEMRELETNAM